MESAQQALPLSSCLCPPPPKPLNRKHQIQNLKPSARFSPVHLQRRRKHETEQQSRPHVKQPPKFEEKDAFPLSLPIHSKNPNAIYKDIQRFARQNKLKEALVILDYMDQQGIPVNITTFNALISACARTKFLPEGRQVHTHIRINGFENNPFLRTKLVHMYTSCGSFEDANEVFDESTSTNTSVYPWNALLRGTVISGKRRVRDVLSLYYKMRELGIELNVYTFSCVIKSLAGASALTQGLKTHALLIKNGFIDYSILRTSLIDMYFKCGKIKLACCLFDETDERDIVLWGVIIAGFAHNRLKLEALDCVRWMINEEKLYPNSVVLTTILPVIGEVSARKLGQEVHAYVLKKERYSKEPFIQSGLVDMYCNCGDMSLARRVFYGTMKRNTILWTALISGYVLNGRLEQGLRSIMWMQQEGLMPDVVTIATILPVCAKLRALRQGKEIHAFAIKKWFLPNVSITTSLMVMYSKCGVFDYSSKLFDVMENRNVISWTAMIDSCIENGRLYDALDVFRSMQMSKHRLDSVSMSRILSVCGELRYLRLGKEIHGQLLKKKFESVPFVAAENIKMYGKCGFVEKAKHVFDAVNVKGCVTWTAMIEAYGYNDLYLDAINLFSKMVSGGFTPNHFTFRAVLSICSLADFGDEACRVFNLMSHKYKIKASEEHYSIMIELLNRVGRTEDAQRFAEMRSSLSLVT